MRGVICGQLYPGDLKEAARCAWMDASISHDRNGILGEVFNALMASYAFVETDIRKILKECIDLIPSDSEYGQVIRFAYEQCLTHDDFFEAWLPCEEKYKKYNYNAKVDVRDVDAGAKALANTAQEAEAMELATWLAQRYAVVNEEGFKEYIQTGLRESIEQEVAADLALLQQAVDNFASNMEAELLEAGHPLQWQNIAQVAANHGKGLTVALGLDLQHLLSYASLELEAMLEKIVKGVFYVYSSYRFDARGEKLTHELQEKLSLEIYEKIEREKRRIVNAIIKLVQQSMEQEMFAPLVNTLEQALEAEAAILAELNADRVATEEKLAQEQQQCRDNVEQLNQYEATLAGYQKEIV